MPSRRDDRCSDAHIVWLGALTPVEDFFIFIIQLYNMETESIRSRWEAGESLDTIWEDLELGPSADAVARLLEAGS